MTLKLNQSPGSPALITWAPWLCEAYVKLSATAPAAESSAGSQMSRWGVELGVAVAAVTGV